MRDRLITVLEQATAPLLPHERKAFGEAFYKRFWDELAEQVRVAIVAELDDLLGPPDASERRLTPTQWRRVRELKEALALLPGYEDPHTALRS